MFHDLKWSPSEKKIARSAFDTALKSALAKAMAEFKRKANAASTPSEMWEIEDYLRQQRREIDETFDYRYSQLPLVFARLIREGIWMKVSLLDCRKKSARSFARSLLSLRKGDGRRPCSTSGSAHERSSATARRCANKAALAA